MTAPYPDVTHAPRRRPGDVGTLYRPSAGQGTAPSGPGAEAGSISVVYRGPLFDGSLLASIRNGIDEMAYLVASQALAEVMNILNQDIRQPTPYYETQVTVQQRQVNDWAVHDRGVVYGPWLEGISNRNRTTSFKGYHAFRRATDEVMVRVPAIIAGVIARVLNP